MDFSWNYKFVPKYVGPNCPFHYTALISYNIIGHFFFLPTSSSHHNALMSSVKSLHDSTSLLHTILDHKFCQCYMAPPSTAPSFDFNYHSNLSCLLSLMCTSFIPTNHIILNFFTSSSLIIKNLSQKQSTLKAKFFSSLSLLVRQPTPHNLWLSSHLFPFTQTQNSWFFISLLRQPLPKL